MKITKGQWLFVAGVFVVNAIVWIIPSDVVELVARDRQTLLGRYSREHLAWIIALIPISAVAVYLHLSPNNAVKKKKAFRVAAVLLVLVPCVLAIDIYLRLTTKWPYVFGQLAYRRPASTVLEDEYEDKPQAIRTYPNAPPGFGKASFTITTDSHGFRNAADLDKYDVVALGDSFTEGSRVKDDQPWPVQFARLSGLTVCNLGMSGYALQHYLAALKDPGLSLQPRQVMCLIFEGNDFRSAKRIAKAPSEWQRFFKRSPIVQAIDEFLIGRLGPVGAGRRVDGLEVLSWMPVAAPPGPQAHHYAFHPTVLVKHYVTRPQFEESKYWNNARDLLEQMHQHCGEVGAELVIVYAPTKPHVVLPLVADALPAEKVRAFVALRAKRELPEPRTFLQELLDNLDVKEAVLADWCRANSIPLVSLTEPLRDSVRRGQQPYYTYNEHWTPIGHTVAAEAVYRFWAARQTHAADRPTEDRPATPGS